MEDQESIINRDSIQTKVSSKDIQLTDSFFRKDINSIINKWLNLQKILKESQSLEKIIEKQHLDNYGQMKKYIHDFYKLKIKSRKIYKDIKSLNINSEWVNITENSEKNEDFYVTESSGTYFGNAISPMKNLISIIREYYDYVPKIVSLIDENDSKQEIESLAEFFCNQFYTNIFIPNPEQEELLICIFKLLEKEINNMNAPNSDTFLEDSSFIGKLMTVFSKQPELNSFLVNLLSGVFNEVDNRDSKVLDLSLKKMLKYIKNEKESKKEKENSNIANVYTDYEALRKKEEKKGINPIERILEKIPKTNINFKKQKILEEEILKDNQTPTNEFSPIYSDDIDLDFKEEKENNDCNTDYFEDLTEKILVQKLKNSTDPELISFYDNLINDLNKNHKNEYAFANSNFFLTLKQNNFFEEKEIIAKIYLKNFLFIQKQVDDIIQSLIDKIITIPYAVRCICTIIDKLIQKRFPKLPKYLRHSFIGKFLFNKCIFPILNFENTNGLKNTIFTKSKTNCLNCIVSVLSNANNCKLFDNKKDVEKTMFNYYLLEIIPILNKFYDKLVDMQLPDQLTELIENTKIIERKRISLLDVMENRVNSENKFDKNLENNNRKQNYDYFKENPDEILRIKSVCFNEKDILFIVRLINKNIELFKNLPEFKRFKLALEQKEMDEDELNRIILEQKDIRKDKKIDIENKGKGYYTFIYNEQNPQLNYKLKEFYKEDKKKKKDEKSLISRIKNSIKTILRRLNLLNIKEYSYLNFATSNEKFFHAINCTLRDFEDEDNKIPLNWHSKFIINNKNKLDKNYLNNDLDKLYEEILEEENNYLNKLKLISPIINTREVMNLNCAENDIEKMELFTKNLEKSKKLEKVKIFIEKDKTELCIILIDPKAIHHSKINKKGKIPDIKDNKQLSIKIEPTNKCIHCTQAFLDSTRGKKPRKIESHFKSVTEFIYKLIKPKGIVHETILRYIKEDIKSGKASHKIFTLFKQYKEFLKQSLIENFKELIEEKNDPNEIMEKIEDYILRKIYKYIFPNDPLNEDLSFYGLTKSYDWLEATDFASKGNIPPEAIQDSISYLKQMEESSFSVTEKIKCLEMVYNNINKITEFYFDKSDKSVEAQAPLFNYIIVKAHPKRFISNINYINCFTKGKDLSSANLLLKNCLASVEFIWKINPLSFQMSAEEFNKRCSDANKRFSIYE